MKIFVCASFAESLILFRRSLLSALVRLGHEVTGCAPEDNPQVAHALEALGVRYLRYRLERTGMNPLKDLGSALSLYGLFRRERPDLVLSYTAKPIIYGSLAAFYAGVPRIYSMVTGLGYAFTDSSLRRSVLAAVIRPLYRRALSKNQAVYLQNADDLGLLRSLGILEGRQRAIVVNGSGVDLEQFSVAPLPKDELVFLMIARLLRDKGVCEYAEAARRLKRRYPQVRFRLVGPLDTNPAAIPADLLRSWEKEGAIEYHGWVDDVRPEISRASVYVLPSYREGTPRTVLEAMAMGRPIVTTDAVGCRETVTEGVNGFKVPVRDSVKLADAMERFIHRPELAMEMGIRSRRLAEEKYDVHKVDARILSGMGLIEGDEAGPG